jgi:hypothetical protein
MCPHAEELVSQFLQTQGKIYKISNAFSRKIGKEDASTDKIYVQSIKPITDGGN